MSNNPVMVVRTQFREDDGVRVELGRCCWVWCPGCDMAHAINVLGEDGSRADVIWDWDGNVERPTFNPSILVTQSVLLRQCHSFLHAGRWQFLGDCGHELAGQTVDMVPLPDWLARERG